MRPAIEKQGDITGFDSVGVIPGGRSDRGSSQKPCFLEHRNTIKLSILDLFFHEIQDRE